MRKQQVTNLGDSMKLGFELGLMFGVCLDRQMHILSIPTGSLLRYPEVSWENRLKNRNRTRRPFIKTGDGASGPPGPGDDADSITVMAASSHWGPDTRGRRQETALL